MIHYGQHLPLRFEPGYDLLRVHPQFHYLQGHTTTDRLRLLGQVNHTAATLPDGLQQLIIAIPAGLS
jgi:hypothetical protein